MKYLEKIKINNPVSIKNNFNSDIKIKFTAKKLAFKLFYNMKAKHISQVDLAEIMGVTPQNISKLLKGQDYKMSTLVRLEQALDINLFDREIYKPQSQLSITIEIKFLKSKPIIVEANLWETLESFQDSKNILQQDIFQQTRTLAYKY